MFISRAQLRGLCGGFQISIVRLSYTRTRIDVISSYQEVRLASNVTRDIHVISSMGHGSLCKSVCVR